ncbi:AAA family ATPase [Bradyrhizobium sp. S69]|uniref:AAA family ATPase n=1 Tax=Bradyrhizobium sp. S69 TaxID=1641856 RepID=UPI00131C0DE8|nr:AAA family ATPase [Bradyrhizobium sp. S69]
MHLLLDILLTDSWEMALRKVALATTAARPDIAFTAQHMTQLTQWHPDHTRRRCLHLRRRLHHNGTGLDLLWLMLAARPGQPWTFGFMEALLSAFNEMEGDLTTIEQGLLPEAMKRFERWECMANGFPAIGDDPFKAVLEKEWLRALAAKKDRDREDRAAAAVAAVEAAERVHERASSLIQELGSLQAAGDVEAYQSSEWVVTVIVGEPKLQAPYKALVGRPTSLLMTPDLREIRDVLRAEFPHATAAIDMMLVDLRQDEPLRFRPFVLVGEPGCGKSRLVRRLAELLGAPLRRYDAAGSSDNSFAGTPKRWSTALACYPLSAIADHKVANPLMLIDEIDKAGMGYTAGNLANALMPFLERETARTYPDPGLEVECDLSHVCYCMTANDDAKLPSPLKDRLRAIKVKSPGVEHVSGLAASILRDLAAELKQPASFMPALAPDELAVVARMWGENGSVRKLQKIISATVTARDEHASRH